MLENLTRAALTRELNEFVRLGRWNYIDQNDLRRRVARWVYIEWEGQSCDMKAIVFMALGRRDPEANTREVEWRVRELGFTVIG